MSQRRTTVKFLSASLVAGVSGLVLLLVFLQLPGRSARYIHVEHEEVSGAPNDGSFAVGPLFWDAEAYSVASSLSPLRELFRKNCGLKVGLEAAVCVSDELADKFPHGSPRAEFFDPTYDPVADFALHYRKGERGDCVTRASLVSVTLLSVKIPSRVVQIYFEQRGHNVVEVWDPGRGWTMFDPTYGKLYMLANGPASAVDAMLHGGEGRWIERGRLPTELEHFYDSLAVEEGPQAIRYPEPWLYMRTGPRAATWPYRSVFVHAGRFDWQLGKGAEYLRPAVLVFFLGAVVLAGSARLSRPRNRPKADQINDKTEDTEEEITSDAA